MVKTLLGLSLIVLAAAAQQKAPRRVALIIANSDYASLPKLPSVKPSADVVEDALRGAAFSQVFNIANFRYPEVLGQVRTISESLQPGDLVFAFYAGYVVQSENDNFLLPVNFDGRNKGDLEGRAYHFKRLQQELEARSVTLKIFVLDAPPQLDIAAGLTDIGLMQPDIAEASETVFVSAAFPGRWAPIPAGAAPSPFSQAVANAIHEHGLSLDGVFNRVKRDPALTQTPYVISVVKQQFYFHEPDKILPPPPPAPDWPRSGLPVTNRTDREEYLWIRPAKFMMGCAPSDTRCAAAEKPRHEVTIAKGFWIGRNEVQVGSYQRYAKAKAAKMPAGPIFDKGWKISDQPIVNVRWDEAVAYCAWAGGRLPTEAEWELAARGGANGEIYPMSGEDNSRDKANFEGKKGNDLFEFVAPVRKFDPNPFGLYDLAGNVWEYVGDYFSATYYTPAAVTDPQGPDSGKEHVIRGGSWASDPKEHLRISYRKGFSSTAPSVGFRCILPDTPETRKLLPEPPK